MKKQHKHKWMYNQATKQIITFPASEKWKVIRFCIGCKKLEEIELDSLHVPSIKSQDYIEITERPDLKTSDILKLMREKFDVYCYYEDKIDTEFPAPKVVTTRKFKKTVEPDAETLGKSAIEADPEQKQITLRERLLLELAYYNETGNHLDVVGWTLCSGSRRSGGDVPDVCWDPGTQEVRVDWSDVSHSGSRCGVRMSS